LLAQFCFLAIKERSDACTKASTNKGADDCATIAISSVVTTGITNSSPRPAPTVRPSGVAVGVVLDQSLYALRQETQTPDRAAAKVILDKDHYSIPLWAPNMVRED
jgi:hypothetical protein